MNQDNEMKNRIVETYAEDMAKVIEDDKSGLIKKIIHEEEEHEKEKKNLSPESTKNKIFIFISLLFILMSFFILFYFVLTKEIPTVSIEKQFTPLIFSDTSTSIEIAGFDKDKIIQTVYNAVAGTKIKTGGIEGIYLLNNKKDIGFRVFMTLIKGNFTPSVLGNDTLFVNDNFLMGVVNNETKDFFILLKVRSIFDIFNVFHAWEKKMFSDLHGFFGVDISPETKYLLTKDWQDGIIENKNARILYDSNNKIVMMYILADDTSVIITNTENAAQEIMLRLASSQIKK